MFCRSTQNQKKVNNKIIDQKLYLINHNGSGFDSYVVLNNLLLWGSIVNLIKNGVGTFRLKFSTHK